MILNGEKFTTTEARYKAFLAFCRSNKCETCRLKNLSDDHKHCAIAWLNMEAKPDIKPMDCPYCGGSCSLRGKTFSYVACDDYSCGYVSKNFPYGMFQECVDAHNAVCIAVQAAKAKEVSDGE